jgi:flagellar biosynthesis/type III secretory pathway chaperone
MNQDVTQLLKCLNTHKHLYGLLLESSEKKRRAIIENDVKTIEQLIGEEENLIKQIEAVEGLRIRCTEMAGKRLHIDGEVTHDKIMESDPEAKKEFGKIGVEIKTLLTRLKDLNSVNNALIHKRLGYIEDITNAFFDSQGNNYGADGKDNSIKIQNKNLFDRMV